MSISPEQIMTLTREAIALGLPVTITEGGRVLIGQPEKKLSTSAERMARKREIDRAKKAAEQEETSRHNPSQSVTAPEEVTEIVTDPSSPSPSLSPSPCPLSPPSPTPSSSPLPLIPSPQSQPHPHQPGVFDFAGVDFDGSGSKPHGKNEETDKTVLTLFSLFNRRPSTMLSQKERQALKAARIQPEDLEAVVEFYADSHPEWDGRDFRKRNLQTMLNNWTGEVDRATAWKASIAPTQSERPLKPIRREETELDPAMAEVHRKLLLGIQGIDPNAPQPGEDDREFIYDRRDD